MYIEDYSLPLSKRSLRYAEKTPGVIVRTKDDTEKDNVFGVYIPRLMFGLPIKNGAYEKTINIDTSKILNSKNKNIGSKALTARNYIDLPVAIVPGLVTPHFRKGENVFIDMADKDIKSMFILPYSLGEQTRRKNDMWSILVPNPKKIGDPLTLDNTYGLQIDTENQTIGIWTSKQNGEKSSYMIGIDAKNGTMKLSDADKRTIIINTDEDSITCKNEANATIEMKKDVISISAKTINITADEDINVKSKKLTRKCDNIKTEGKEDEEKVDKFKGSGNEYTLDYNTQKISGSSYENKTSKWKVDSPISGFTKILTADSFSIWPNAGVIPSPTCANISNAGIASMGNPSLAAMPLTKQQPLSIALSTMCAVIDAIGCIHCVPPTLSAGIAAMSPTMMTMNSKG